MLRELDTVGRTTARLGGDEFVGVLPGVTNDEQLDIVQDRVHVNLDTNGIQASMGGKVHTPGESGQDLLASVDGLMYVQKRERREERRVEQLSQLEPEARDMLGQVRQQLGSVGLSVKNFCELAAPDDSSF